MKYFPCRERGDLCRCGYKLEGTLCHITNPICARLVAAEGSSGSEWDVWSLDEPLESEGLATKLPGTLETAASSCASNNRSSSCWMFHCICSQPQPGLVREQKMWKVNERKWKSAFSESHLVSCQIWPKEPREFFIYSLFLLKSSGAITSVGCSAVVNISSWEESLMLKTSMQHLVLILKRYTAPVQHQPIINVILG